VCPVPLDWNNISAFIALSLRVKAKAHELGIKIRYGGDFKNLADFPHYELV
jgi:peptidoglycan L-alanyl-D-glutamate endopeptidase CwlK